MPEPCEHVTEIRHVMPRANGCEGCIALGEEWNELRVCLACGHVGCCEDSAHAHALQHFNTTGHPLIAPYERSETWGWCYAHHRYVDVPSELLPWKRSVLGTAFARFFRR